MNFDAAPQGHTETTIEKEAVPLTQEELIILLDVERAELAKHKSMDARSNTSQYYYSLLDHLKKQGIDEGKLYRRKRNELEAVGAIEYHSGGWAGSYSRIYSDAPREDTEEEKFVKKFVGLPEEEKIRIVLRQLELMTYDPKDHEKFIGSLSEKGLQFIVDSLIKLKEHETVRVGERFWAKFCDLQDIIIKQKQIIKDGLTEVPSLSYYSYDRSLMAQKEWQWKEALRLTKEGSIMLRPE